METANPQEKMQEVISKTFPAALANYLLFTQLLDSMAWWLWGRA